MTWIDEAPGRVRGLIDSDWCPLDGGDEAATEAERRAARRQTTICRRLALVPRHPVIAARPRAPGPLLRAGGDRLGGRERDDVLYGPLLIEYQH